MRRLPIALSLAVLAAPSFAQSWTAGDGGIAVPASVGGASVAGAAVTCRADTFYLALTGTPVGDGASEVPVALLIDGKLFATSAAADGRIAIPAAAVEGLKSGNRLTLNFPSGGQSLETVFALKGSSKALETLAANCAAPDTPEQVAGNGGTIEVADAYQAGTQAEIAFTVPDKPNNYWVGFVPKGAGPTDFLSNGYAYTSAGSPAKLTVPGMAGDYEVRLADDTDKAVLAAKPVTVTAPGTATVDGPATATGGQMIEVTHSGPSGASNLVVLVAAGAGDGTYHAYQQSYTGTSPATLRAPVSGGDYELRYVLGVGQAVVLARKPITVTQAPAVTLTAAEAAAGTPVTVVLGADAPRGSGDYIYIAKPGTPGNNYDGGYVSVPSSGDAQIPAPGEAGAWELRYVAPDNGTWTALGSAALTVK
ncbi:MAG: hypothetical protein H6891_06745 [Brucellaceae bacterium]|nr:hypothetical protein [Brucellaceae bacterium]